ncbi:hypothetical protein MPL1032_60026 [Mesorhizobium plurifarium]|uniref:Uncharacterized protein n=1 Tax=Mesorhizobium plurifarium TaxID=69974 RepID=A0A0K2W5U6_MESPL|nr:hypothetical protein MPL1032_60026 [Mesorhizobium plurifarium]
MNPLRKQFHSIALASVRVFPAHHYRMCTKPVDFPNVTLSHRLSIKTIAAFQQGARSNQQLRIVRTCTVRGVIEIDLFGKLNSAFLTVVFTFYS